MERDRVLTIRMTDEEMAMVKAVATNSGLKQSDAVRQLIRRAFDELPSKPRKKK